MSDDENKLTYIVGYATHEGWDEFASQTDLSTEDWHYPYKDSGFSRMSVNGSELDSILGRNGRDTWKAVMVKMSHDTMTLEDQRVKSLRFIHDHFTNYLKGCEWDMIDCSPAWTNAHVMIRFKDEQLGLILKLSAPDVCTVETVC